MANLDAIHIVDQLPGFIILYSDGSISRPNSLSPTIPCSSEFANGAAAKDVLIHPPTNVMARIFLPAVQKRQRLPIVLHFHGGGMCIGSAFSDPFHSFCFRMAVKSRSIWISVEYRLAPEHRLPAAYDDAYTALTWLRSQAGKEDGSGVEQWLSRFGDFSNCFLAGESAGGAIVHYLAMRAAGKDLTPVQIRGLMIIHASLLRGMPQAKPSTDGSLTEDRMATYLRFVLPLTEAAAAAYDHPLVNPFHSDMPSFSHLDLYPILVMTADRDILTDANVEYFEALRKAGKQAELFVSKGKGHCFHLKEAKCEERNALEDRLAYFIMEKLQGGATILPFQ